MLPTHLLNMNILNRFQLSDANGKAKEALKQTQTQLQRTADELRQAHPEVEQQATALKDKLQNAVQTTVQVNLHLLPLKDPFKDHHHLRYYQNSVLLCWPPLSQVHGSQQ